MWVVVAQLAKIEYQVSGNDQNVLCALGDITLSDPPTSDSFDLVARNYDLVKELLQEDQHTVHEEKLIKTATEVIPATSCSADCSFRGIRRFKTYLRSTMGQNRLNSLAIACTERSYGNKVIVNSMNKIFSVSFDVRVVNVFVFHAIWVRLYPDFNNHAFGNCVFFSGKKVTPPPNSKGARTPMISNVMARFWNECRKTRTKVITLTNHKRNKNQTEPMRNWSKYK